MKTHQAWEAFPTSYRKEEMKTLAQWILAGESGSVVGLPGCGRTNLLEFLGHRPEVLSALLQFLSPEAGSAALIPVDLNTLPASDLSTLYRVTLRSFYWVQERFDQDIKDVITTLYQENRTATDPFLPQSALHELLFVFQAKKIRVVLILNRLDHFCRVATPQMVNTLRGLRDSFKETLCFIAGMRQEVTYWSDPDALGDMYELLDSRVCWVGPMNADDARQVIARRTATASSPPSKAEVQAMLDLAGGFPVLLRAISHWWLSATNKPPISKWLAALAAERGLDYRLARLWNGLTQEEQFALSSICEEQDRMAQADDKRKTRKEAFTTLANQHGPVLFRLKEKGLCQRIQTSWQIRGALMANYVKRVGPISRGRIRIDEKTQEIHQGLTLLRDLPPRDDALLRFLIKNPYDRHPYSELLNVIFADPKLNAEEGEFLGRTKDDLFSYINSLRRRIEVHPSEPRYIINYQSYPEGGYQFYPEGRPE